jgi:hypothetical protein
MLYSFSVYDKKASSYNTPFMAATPELARRSFEDLIRDKRTVVGQHPEDYSLFMNGTFDQESGFMSGLEGGPLLVCEGMEAFANVLRYDKDFQTMIKQMSAEPAESQS